MLLSNCLSVRLLVIFWLLPMIVLIYAYTGVLTAILAVPKLEPNVDNFDQLAEGFNNFQLTIERSSKINSQWYYIRIIIHFPFFDSSNDNLNDKRMHHRILQSYRRFFEGSSRIAF